MAPSLRDPVPSSVFQMHIDMCIYANRHTYSYMHIDTKINLHLFLKECIFAIPLKDIPGTKRDNLAVKSTFTVLPRNQSSVHNTHMRWVTCTCNSTSRGLEPLWKYVLTRTYFSAHIHKHMNENDKNNPVNIMDTL